ncbi:MAG TPA: non-histone chromosomal MC1 family protein [Candidatus Thalassarchaeaceae archaeon]|nr:non-histone chromosomal MC1 family protein [Candidatus Thalassarchaeaceae archaeon]
MGEKKYFVLMKNGKDTAQVFHSRQPRGAALKAASRGETDIQLRERGTNRVHVFSGEKKKVPKGANAPDWLPDMINRANVKKLRINRI